MVEVSRVLREVWRGVELKLFTDRSIHPSQAISSIIYSAQRIGDVPEVLALRKMFESK